TRPWTSDPAGATTRPSRVRIGLVSRAVNDRSTDSMPRSESMRTLTSPMALSSGWAALGVAGGGLVCELPWHAAKAVAAMSAIRMCMGEPPSFTPALAKVLPRSEATDREVEDHGRLSERRVSVQVEAEIERDGPDRSVDRETRANRITKPPRLEVRLIAPRV